MIFKSANPFGLWPLLETKRVAAAINHQYQAGLKIFLLPTHYVPWYVYLGDAITYTTRYNRLIDMMCVCVCLYVCVCVCVCASMFEVSPTSDSIDTLSIRPTHLSSSIIITD